MKAILLLSLFFFAVDLYADEADTIASEVICPEHVSGFYVPHAGESPKDAYVKQLIVDSPGYIQNYMLKRAPEILKLHYALAILAEKHINLPEETKRKEIFQKQLILGRRLAELEPKTEQDAAANP